MSGKVAWFVSDVASTFVQLASSQILNCGKMVKRIEQIKGFLRICDTMVKRIERIKGLLRIFLVKCTYFKQKIKKNPQEPFNPFHPFYHTIAKPSKSLNPFIANF